MVIILEFGSGNAGSIPAGRIMVTKQDYLYVIFGSKDKGFEFTGIFTSRYKMEVYVKGELEKNPARQFRCYRTIKNNPDIGLIKTNIH